MNGLLRDLACQSDGPGFSPPQTVGYHLAVVNVNADVEFSPHSPRLTSPLHRQMKSLTRCGGELVTPVIQRCALPHSSRIPIRQISRTVGLRAVQVVPDDRYAGGAGQRDCQEANERHIAENDSPPVHGWRAVNVHEQSVKRLPQAAVWLRSGCGTACGAGCGNALSLPAVVAVCPYRRHRRHADTETLGTQSGGVEHNHHEGDEWP